MLSNTAFSNRKASEIQIGDLHAFTIEFNAEGDGDWNQLTGRLSLPSGVGTPSFIRGSGSGFYPEGRIYIVDSLMMRFTK